MSVKTIVPWCESCDRIYISGGRTRRPAVAWWTVWNDGGYPVTWPVCQRTLDICFDNADDDPPLEPIRVAWIDGSRPPVDNLTRGGGYLAPRTPFELSDVVTVPRSIIDASSVDPIEEATMQAPDLRKKRNCDLRV